MSSSIKTERREQGKGVEKRHKCSEKKWWDIERGQVIREKRGEVGFEVKTRSEGGKQTESSRDAPSSS